MSNCEKCGYYSDGECNICGMGMSGEDNLKKIIKHIDHNRQTKAYKLTRIERLVLDCMNGGYTDEVLQRIFDICREPEPILKEEG